MDGFYIANQKQSESSVPTGRLNISVTNLTEFEKLIEQAKEEAEHLRQTIDRLQYFDLKIDFNIKREITEQTINHKASREHVSMGKTKDNFATET